MIVVTRGGVNGILPIVYITVLYLLLLDSEVHTKYLFVYNYLLACKRRIRASALIHSFLPLYNNLCSIQICLLPFNKRAKERKGGALTVIIARK